MIYTLAYKIRIHPWSWIGQKAWDLQVQRSFGRWTLVLTAWNIRPKSSLAFTLARRGRLDELRDALVSRKASIYDCTPDGRTLLDVSLRTPGIVLSSFADNVDQEAASGVHPAVMKMLMRMGLSHPQPHNLLALAPIVVARASRGSVELVDFFHVSLGDGLLQNTGEGGGASDTDCSNRKRELLDRVMRWWYWRDPEIKQLMRERGIPGLELDNSVSTFRDIWWLCTDPKVTLRLLQETGITPATLRQQLDRILRASPDCLFDKYFRSLITVHWTENRDEVDAWRRVVRWIFDKIRPDEINYIGFLANPSSTIPLINYTRIVQYKCDDPQRLKHIEAAFAIWLEDLAMAGVNLQEYGEHERRHLPGWHKVRQMDHKFEAGCNVLYWFTYGPRPEDWHFFWSFGVEGFAGEFWKLVEPRQIDIPGAWVIEDGDEEAYTV